MAAIIEFLFNSIFNIFKGCLEGVSGLIEALITPARKVEYDAGFIPASQLLSSWNKGFCLTGKMSLTIHDSFKNALVIGSTGNYKSSGILIPSILKMRGHSSLIINDPSSELFNKTSGALQAAGYEVKVIRYASPKESEGYNPLYRAKSATDIQKISKMLVQNAMGHSKGDPFWSMAADSLITLCCRYILNYTDKKYHNLYNVYYIISVLAYAPQKIDKLLIRSDSALLNDYKAFISYGDRTISSIIATARTALSLFNSPAVGLTTSHDTIDFTEFRKKKTALFINTSVADMRYYSLTTSVFLEQFFGHMMSNVPGPDELPIFFLLDEASSLYFPNLQITCANIRKHSGGLLMIFQSLSQIIDIHTQPVARSIIENCYARVFMGGQPIQVAQELEATLGKFEYKDEKDVRHIRPLMTAAEIHETTDSLIFCGANRAIKTPIHPYFRNSKLLRLSNLPPLQPINKLPFDSETPPTIDLDAA